MSSSRVCNNKFEIFFKEYIQIKFQMGVPLSQVLISHNIYTMYSNFNGEIRRFCGNSVENTRQFRGVTDKKAAYFFFHWYYIEFNEFIKSSSYRSRIIHNMK